MQNYAILFPGQGSQSLKMMDEFVNDDTVRNIFQLSHQILGVDLWGMLQEETANNINQTINTQVLMLTSAYAIYKSYLQHHIFTPKFVAGHSLGEYTALVAAGVITFEDALQLVQVRAKLMQSVGDKYDGMMSAILGFSAEEVTEFCLEVSYAKSEVDCANFNTPAQTVVAGHKDAGLRLNDLVKTKGGKSIVLPVSVPSHCSLMLDISNNFRSECNKINFSRADVPVVSNVSGISSQDALVLKELLIEQLYSPVQWVKTIEYMAQHQVNTFIETGPGKILTGLGKKIKPDATHILIKDFV